jgi:PAS domain S-box-containing protein
VSVSEPLVQSVLLGDAVEHAPVAILVADDEMRYVAVNQYACDLLGYSREQLLEKRIPDIARYPEAPDEFREMMAKGGLEGVSTVVRADGSELKLRYRAKETTMAGLTYYVSVAWPDEA